MIAAIFIQFVTPVEREKLFADIKRALKPGGLLLMQGYRPEQLTYKTGGPQQVEHHFAYNRIVFYQQKSHVISFLFGLLREHVIPAQAGIHGPRDYMLSMDPRLRGDDGSA